MAESLAMLEDRSYRKSLVSSGLIYINSCEYEIHVLNISLTGVLVKLQAHHQINNIQDFNQSLQISTLVDFYLPELRLAGEAEIVRTELVEAALHLGLEFHNLSFEINPVLYKRQVYRKNLHAVGKIFVSGVEYAFTTENVSVQGLMIRILGRTDIQVGVVAVFEFEQLQLAGQAEIVWIERDYHSSLLGLNYVELQRQDIKGIPQFRVGSVAELR
jgi:hypothetical protein